MAISSHAGPQAVIAHLVERGPRPQACFGPGPDDKNALTQSTGPNRPIGEPGAPGNTLCVWGAMANG